MLLKINNNFNLRQNISVSIYITPPLTSLLLAFFLCIPAKVFACDDNLNTGKCVQISVHNKTGQGVPDLVVYLQPLEGQILPKTTEIVTISQQEKAFSPYITVSQKGNKVNFENKDDITHHIYSVNSDDKFAFKIQAGTNHLSESFDHESEIAMGCNIHDWMSGSLLVVDTPYFAKTDSNGSVSFSLDEKGKYQVIVWHPQLPEKDNRLSQQFNSNDDSNIKFILQKNLETIPAQESNDDFDFVSDY